MSHSPLISGIMADSASLTPLCYIALWFRSLTHQYIHSFSHHIHTDMIIYNTIQYDCCSTVSGYEYS